MFTESKSLEQPRMPKLFTEKFYQYLGGFIYHELDDKAYAEQTEATYFSDIDEVKGNHESVQQLIQIISLQIQQLFQRLTACMQQHSPRNEEKLEARAWEQMTELFNALQLNNPNDSITAHAFGAGKKQLEKLVEKLESTEQLSDEEFTQLSTLTSEIIKSSESSENAPEKFKQCLRHVQASLDSQKAFPYQVTSELSKEETQPRYFEDMASTNDDNSAVIKQTKQLFARLQKWTLDEKIQHEPTWGWPQISDKYIGYRSSGPVPSQLLFKDGKIYLEKLVSILESAKEKKQFHYMVEYLLKKDTLDVCHEGMVEKIQNEISIQESFQPSSQSINPQKLLQNLKDNSIKTIAKQHCINLGLYRGNEVHDVIAFSKLVEQDWGLTPDPTTVEKSFYFFRGMSDTEVSNRKHALLKEIAAIKPEVDIFRGFIETYLAIAKEIISTKEFTKAANAFKKCLDDADYASSSYTAADEKLDELLEKLNQALSNIAPLKDLERPGNFKEQYSQYGRERFLLLVQIEVILRLKKAGFIHHGLFICLKTFTQTSHFSEGFFEANHVFITNDLNLCYWTWGETVYSLTGETPDVSCFFMSQDDNPLPFTKLIEQGYFEFASGVLKHFNPESIDTYRDVLTEALNYVTQNCSINENWELVSNLIAKGADVKLLFSERNDTTIFMSTIHNQDYARASEMLTWLSEERVDNDNIFILALHSLIANYANANRDDQSKLIIQLSKHINFKKFVDILKQSDNINNTLPVIFRHLTKEEKFDFITNLSNISEFSLIKLLINELPSCDIIDGIEKIERSSLTNVLNKLIENNQLEDAEFIAALVNLGANPAKLFSIPDDEKSDENNIPFVHLIGQADAADAAEIFNHFNPEPSGAYYEIFNYILTCVIKNNDIKQSWELVRALIAKGADVNLLFSEIDGASTSAFLHAINYQYYNQASEMLTWLGEERVSDNNNLIMDFEIILINFALKKETQRSGEHKLIIQLSKLVTPEILTNFLTLSSTINHNQFNLFISNLDEEEKLTLISKLFEAVHNCSSVSIDEKSDGNNIPFVHLIGQADAADAAKILNHFNPEPLDAYYEIFNCILTCVIQNNKIGEDWELVRALIAKGADVNLLFSEINGATVFKNAIKDKCYTHASEMLTWFEQKQGNDNNIIDASTVLVNIVYSDQHWSLQNKLIIQLSKFIDSETLANTLQSSAEMNNQFSAFISRLLEEEKLTLTSKLFEADNFYLVEALIQQLVPYDTIEDKENIGRPQLTAILNKLITTSQLDSNVKLIAELIYKGANPSQVLEEEEKSEENFKISPVLLKQVLEELLEKDKWHLQSSLIVQLIDKLTLDIFLEKLKLTKLSKQHQNLSNFFEYLLQQKNFDLLKKLSDSNDYKVHSSLRIMFGNAHHNLVVDFVIWAVTNNHLDATRTTCDMLLNHSGKHILRDAIDQLLQKNDQTIHNKSFLEIISHYHNCVPHTDHPPFTNKQLSILTSFPSNIFNDNDGNINRQRDWCNFLVDTFENLDRPELSKDELNLLLKQFLLFSDSIKIQYSDIINSLISYGADPSLCFISNNEYEEEKDEKESTRHTSVSSYFLLLVENNKFQEATEILSYIKLNPNDSELNQLLTGALLQLISIPYTNSEDLQNHIVFQNKLNHLIKLKDLIILLIEKGANPKSCFPTHINNAPSTIVQLIVNSRDSNDIAPLVILKALIPNLYSQHDSEWLQLLNNTVQEVIIRAPLKPMSFDSITTLLNRGADLKLCLAPPNINYDEEKSQNAETPSQAPLSYFLQLITNDESHKAKEILSYIKPNPNDDKLNQLLNDALKHLIQSKNWQEQYPILIQALVAKGADAGLCFNNKNQCQYIQIIESLLTKSDTYNLIDLINNADNSLSADNRCQLAICLLHNCSRLNYERRDRVIRAAKNLLSTLDNDLSDMSNKPLLQDAITQAKTVHQSTGYYTMHIVTLADGFHPLVFLDRCQEVKKAFDRISNPNDYNQLCEFVKNTYESAGWFRWRQHTDKVLEAIESASDLSTLISALAGIKITNPVGYLAVIQVVLGQGYNQQNPQQPPRTAAIVAR
jgi:hypothetical protein